jgi:hypothetical protein
MADMTKMKKNMYAEAQARREAEQAAIKQACGMKVETGAKKKVRLDVTISPVSKNRLLQYASERCLSASVVIQMLIDEHCI